MICNALTREQSNALYAQVLRDGDTEAMRRLCREDLFFLLTVACKRKDIDNGWLYQRCREVERDPDECLDLWAREHYKSTIITFGKTLQDILASHGDNPLAKFGGREITVGIFSHTRPVSKAFLVQIKEEFEGNTFLQDLFPDVLYREPRKESPQWSVDNGIRVRRKSNPKEATIEAWGLVDGQPTSKHFFLLIYDDVVTLESVTTSDQIKKTTQAWEMSLNLGDKDGIRRYIGTRYHYNDTYRTMLDRQTAKPRIHAATVDGSPDGDPVFLSREALAAKRRAFGPYVFGSQMLQNPVADKVMGFEESWLRFYETKLNTSGWNIYITVDPAGEKKKDNDYTVIDVHGLSPDGNYYMLDGVRDRMNLTERTQCLFRLVREWNPIRVGYEKYGLQADIEHIRFVMELENYRFSIVELGGSMPKNDRIRRLVPVFEQGRFYLPRRSTFIDIEGKYRDFVDEFLRDEYGAFPVATHDDMLDCKARILDPALRATFPERQEYKVDAAYDALLEEVQREEVAHEYDVLAM